MSTARKVVMIGILDPALEIERAILEPLGVELIPHEYRSEDDVIAAAYDAVAVTTVIAPITRRVIEHLVNCRLVVKCGVGFDNIDVEAATEHGICVVNVPDYGIDEVATHTLALILNSLRHIADITEAVRRGEWVSTPPYPIQRSAGQVLGIVGFGRIGRSLAQKTRGFAWRLLVHDLFVDAETIRGYGAEPVDLDTVLTQADFVVLHVPLTKQTHHLIDAKALDKMKSTAFLVNTSRGGVVDSQALYRALQGGRIAGAALDVLEEEPPSNDHPLLSCARALVTSHVAWYSVQAVNDLRLKAAEEIARMLRGEPPLNPVNATVRTHLNQREV